MKIIEASHEIIKAPLYGEALNLLEVAARVCYKSEDKIKPGSAEKLIESCIRRGHHSILEHINITVRFICSRGISHELVRHRHCAFSHESTRYCNYGGKDMEFIKPFWFDESDSLSSARWNDAMDNSAFYYNDMLQKSLLPQAARGVLPNDLKTEIIVTANIREWRHILDLRTAGAAHPDMRILMKPLLAEFKEKYPVLFANSFYSFLIEYYYKIRITLKVLICFRLPISPTARENLRQIWILFFENCFFQFN